MFSPQDLHHHARLTSFGFLPETLNSRNLPAPERKTSRRKGQVSAKNGPSLLTSIPGTGKVAKLICPLWILRYSPLPEGSGPRISLSVSVFHLLQAVPRQIHTLKELFWALSPWIQMLPPPFSHKSVLPRTGSTSGCHPEMETTRPRHLHPPARH